jgi:hypothetical protein
MCVVPIPCLDSNKIELGLDFESEKKLFVEELQTDPFLPLRFLPTEYDSCINTYFNKDTR